MEGMAGKLADRFYSKKAFQTMSYEAFKYVLEFSLKMAADILASVVIAAALGMEWETAAFLLIFWILRSYAGGLHLEKFSHCFVSILLLYGEWQMRFYNRSVNRCSVCADDTG